MGQKAIFGRGRTYYVEGVGILFDHGTTLPSDGVSDFAPGCLFQKTDGTAGAQFYVNEGTLSSASFKAVDTGTILATNIPVVDTADWFTSTNCETILAEIGELLLASYGTAAGDGPSPLIWSDCPLLEMMVDPTKGYYYFDDFMGQTVDPAATDDNAGFTVTRATAGTIGSVIGVGGELHLAAAATADQGMNVQLLNCCVKPTAAKTIWFEARVQVSKIDNQIFVGLASTETAIIAAGEIDEASMSAIGFFTDEPSATTKYGTITSKAGNNDTTEDIAVGFVADTWAKVGFKVTGITAVDFYYNGILVEAGVTAESIPDAVELALSLVCQNEDGANVNTLKVDWVRVAQLR